MCEADMTCVPRQQWRRDASVTRWLPDARALGVCDVRMETHAMLEWLGAAQSLESRRLVLR